MKSVLQPGSVDDLQEAVRSAPRVLAVGAETKSRLAQADAEKISMLGLSGLTEYEPEEFTFSALAGTPVREIAAALAQKGQYLPFDPLLVESGATLGGTVASGLSGPGRLRFGGLRDFIIGARIVDGAGRLQRVGGKVVKNAAGFDLPKFLVGSLGRFGILAECTFKVFPRPAAEITLSISIDSPEAARNIFCDAPACRWEPAALDLPPDGKTVLLRLGGPVSALEPLAREILSRWRGRILAGDEAGKWWSDLREFRWAHHEGHLAKIVLTPSAWPALAKGISMIDGARVHVSGAGNLAFVSLKSPDQTSAVDKLLMELNLSGMTLRGVGPLWLGARPRAQLGSSVKVALDPQNRFPGLDD